MPALNGRRNRTFWACAAGNCDIYRSVIDEFKHYPYAYGNHWSTVIFMHCKSRLILFAVGIIQFSICLLGISRNPITPFDEPAHFDYVAKIAHGHLPKVNEKYGQVALESQACMKSRYEAWSYIEPCGSHHYTARLAPFYGQSSATGYLPTYYFLTAIPYDVCDLVTSTTHLNCGRLANSLWLVGASIVMTQLGVIVGANAIFSGIVAISINSIGTVLLQGITVNSDAAIQMIAPLLVLCTFWVNRKLWRQHSRLIAWFLICAFASSIKLTIAPMLIISTYVMASFESESVVSPLARLRNYIKYFTSAGLGIGLIYALLAAQPFLRGIGGKDIMKDWLIAHDESTFLSSMWLTLHSTLQPFSLLTWSPHTTSLLLELANLIALLGWICFSGIGKTVGFRSISNLGGLGILVSVVTPLLMCWWSWKSYGSASVQPRYYMATLSTFLFLGTVGSRDRIFKAIVLSVLLINFAQTFLALFRFKG